MKLKKCLFLMFALFIPFTNIVSADEVEKEPIKNFNITTGDTVTFEEDVDGSSVVVGNNVISSGNISGINMLFGNNVTFKGNSDYALLVGNNIELDGIINNDGVILGNVVDFKNNTISNRDLFVFGSSVTLSGTINRDIIIYASTVVVSDAEIKGNIKINATNIEVKDNVIVNGELSYNEDAVIELSNEANITNTVLAEKLIKEVSFQERITTIITDYCSYLMVFLALAIITPSLFKRIEKTNEDFSLLNVFSTLGFGALSLILIPVIFIVLLSILIGGQLAILLMVLYIVVIWLSIIFTGYLTGYIIWKKFIKKEQNTLLVGLFGITVITILNNIPLIGGLISVASLMIGVGIVVRMFRNPEFIESN